MRTLLIAANWKMNPAPAGALEHTSPYHPRTDMDVVVFPSFLDIPACCHSEIITGGQCGHPEQEGAHTGDVSMAMLAQAGCRYVLCGHSERRADHNESDTDIGEQVIAALEAGLHPVVCVGETQAERKKGKEQEVVQKQINVLPMESDLTIAYEPVWAIGTGETATPEQAQEMHAFIRSLLPQDRQEKTRILYGGSMKPANAEELLSQPDIDGGLIGGAALDPAQFGQIIEIATGLSV
jgi:triosephosphate isomerase